MYPVALIVLALAIVVVVLLARRWTEDRNELIQHVNELSTIQQVSRQVAVVLELDELFRRVVNLIRDSFGYYHVGIYTTDEARQTVTFQTSSSAGELDVAFEVKWGQGLVGWVAAHRQAVTVNDVVNDTRYRCVEALEETRSELVVPLMLEDEQVGLLDVQSDQLRAFSAHDLFILETLGGQVAIAIQKARLYEAERRQAWLSTALLQVAEAASRLSDMNDVLTTIVRLVPLLAGVERCAILLWDSDAELFVPAQTHGLPPELRETFDRMLFSPGTVPALDAIRWQANPLLIDPGRDRGLIPVDVAEIFDIQEMVLLPLLAQGEFLGAMMVDYAGSPHPFSERIVDMLTGMANQAASVIHSARLVQSQQEEAYTSMALLQVAETVSRSTDLKETLAAVVRITPMLVGVEACAILLWDASAENLIPFQQYGFRGTKETAFWRLGLTNGDSTVRRLLAGEPFVTLDERLDGVSSDGVPDSTLTQMAEDASLLVLPLVTRGEVVGSMLVEYHGPVQRFARRWTSILSGIAGQAAVAVESNRLLQEAAERERMRQELELARRIQTSFLPECCPTVAGWDLAAVWRSARQVGGDFYDFIPLPPEAGQAGRTGDRTGVVIADVADKGVPAALFMALSRTLMRTMAIDGRPPDTAVAQANDLILADARTELFVTLFYAVLSSDSGQVTYVNAGHMPPLLLRAAGGATEELWTRGMALGVLPELEFAAYRTHLELGDTLVFYTDGVIEASDSRQEMFGKERLIEVAKAHLAQSAADLARAIDEAISTFVGDAPQFDDFTLVVAKRAA